MRDASSSGEWRALKHLRLQACEFADAAVRLPREALLLSRLDRPVSHLRKLIGHFTAWV